MKELVKRHLIFVDAEQTMSDVVAIMRDNNISSVLVLNQARIVTGIVTERDIVQKFTLLEKQEKLQASVAAFMTRPVFFARLAQLESDVQTMFFKKRLRHFPVTADTLHEKDVIGMLTVTDMSGGYLRALGRTRQAVSKGSLYIVAEDSATRQRYQTLFTALNFHVVTGADLERVMQEALASGEPIVFDVDGLQLEEGKKALTKLREHRGIFILLSSQPNLVEPLKKLLTSEQHCVALKPLDISYILLLLTRLQHLPS